MRGRRRGRERGERKRGKRGRVGGGDGGRQDQGEQLVGEGAGLLWESRQQEMGPHFRVGTVYVEGRSH